MEYGCAEKMCPVQYCSEKCAVENIAEHMTECLASLPTKASHAILTAVKNCRPIVASQVQLYQVVFRLSVVSLQMFSVPPRELIGALPQRLSRHSLDERCIAIPSDYVPKLDDCDEFRRITVCEIWRTNTSQVTVGISTEVGKGGICQIANFLESFLTSSSEQVGDIERSNSRDQTFLWSMLSILDCCGGCIGERSAGITQVHICTLILTQAEIHRIK